MTKQLSKQAVGLQCDHCGDPCPDPSIELEQKFFCCQGCKTVYQVLHEHGLDTFYTLDPNAGKSQRTQDQQSYEYLDEEEVRQKLCTFRSAEQERVVFLLPQMHCSACIWLLEKLYDVREGILQSTVNFTQRKIYLSYDPDTIPLSEIAALLAQLGYPPQIRLSDLEEQSRARPRDKRLIYQLGFAGFAFGNIMLLSFPEYLGLDADMDAFYHRMFGYLNILLALPVLLYSGRDYLQAAWRGLQQRDLTIDLPVAIGMLALFGRSAFEILSHQGAGYMDSLAGLVFFLLVGKWFQQRTYAQLSFDRDFKSYFPLAARVLRDGTYRSVSLDQLQKGDQIQLRHQELIPADGTLVRGEALIDYSFVTGEGRPERIRSGGTLYAGGRQVGTSIDMVLARPVAQSYLTQLWNDAAFAKKETPGVRRLARVVGRNFTIFILTLATLTLAYWIRTDVGLAFNAFTAVLIIACPCAIALSIPFIFGNVLRLLSSRQCYLKSTDVIEAAAAVDTVVFDKTGTLTTNRRGGIQQRGQLTPKQIQILRSMIAISNHPVSRLIHDFLPEGNTLPPIQLEDWTEITGAGLQATVAGKQYRLGKPSMAVPEADGHAGTVFSVDGVFPASFHIEEHRRAGLSAVLDHFRTTARSYLLSGDRKEAQWAWVEAFPQEEHRRFGQLPQDKLQFIRELEESGQRVMMVGDGLNDAGALRASTVGMVITEDTNNFTPASDIILSAERFELLPRIMRFMRRSIHLVYAAYGLALIYNVVGLSYAVQGALSPVIAAILMPASSTTIVVFGLLSSRWLAQRMLGPVSGG